MFCHKCGMQISEEAEFCHKCGAKVVHTDAGPQTRANPTESGKATSETPAEETDDFYEALWGKFKALSAGGKALALLALSFGVIVLVIVIRIAFSSLIALLISIAVGYCVYQRWIANYVTEYIYDKSGYDELQLPEGMNAQTLIEALSGKFNYPYFKGARYGAKGECLIEGKYTVYPVDFFEDKEGKCAFLDYDDKDKEDKIRIILREAIAIRSYINKFFNPSLPYDAVKDLKALKSVERQCKANSIVTASVIILVCVAAGIEYGLPGGIQRITRPGVEVRDSYLSQYSDEVTIEEAFDNFFANEKWSTYKLEGYSYVVFTGTCEYMEEQVYVKITFKIAGEKFRVDSLDIDGEEQNDFMLALMLAKVYEEY